jgi:hypothetical protein
MPGVSVNIEKDIFVFLTAFLQTTKNSSAIAKTPQPLTSWFNGYFLRFLEELYD